MAFRNGENGLWSKVFEQVPFLADGGNVRMHTNLVLGSGSVSASEGVNSATNVTVSSDPTNAARSVIQLNVTDGEGWIAYRNPVYTGHSSNVGTYNQFKKTVMNVDGTGSENVRVSAFDVSGRYAPLRYSRDVSGSQPIHGTEFEYQSPTQTDMVFRAYDASGVGTAALRIAGNTGAITTAKDVTCNGNVLAQTVNSYGNVVAAGDVSCQTVRAQTGIVSAGDVSCQTVRAQTGIVSYGDVSINGGNTVTNGSFRRIGGASSNGYFPSVAVTDMNGILSPLPKIIAYTRQLYLLNYHDYNVSTDGVAGTVFEVPNDYNWTYGTSDSDMSMAVACGTIEVAERGQGFCFTLQFGRGVSFFPLGTSNLRPYALGFVVRRSDGIPYSRDALNNISFNIAINIMITTPYN